MADEATVAFLASNPVFQVRMAFWESWSTWMVCEPSSAELPAVAVRTVSSEHEAVLARNSLMLSMPSMDVFRESREVDR